MPAPALAQDLSSATRQIIITGSVAQRRAEEAPFAIGVVDAEALRLAGPQINLSEALVRVPGLVINDRSNYAQDLQISSRGFGARSNSGVRGIRLYADGIPASGPDGQGQVSHFDLMGAQRIEVLRGPYSVLFGNSSGGVISLVGPVLDKPAIGGGLDIGSFGMTQIRVSITAAIGEGLGMRVGVSDMRLEGFRPQSAAQRTAGHLTLGWQNDENRVRLTVNHLSQPADDPLGLSRDQFHSDPYGVASVVKQFDVRKLTFQSQAGRSWRHIFGNGALRESLFASYIGKRSVTQWLVISPGTQANARHGGGVIAFDRDCRGVDARLRWSLGPVDVMTGAALDRQHDDRRGYENFTGTGSDQIVGVSGRLRRQEHSYAQSRDVYAQAEWPAADALLLSLGVRSGGVKMRSDDVYLGNGNDSGSVDYHYTNPVAGVRWTLLRERGQSLLVHASLARGFEAPSLGELAYRGDGTGGFNSGLKRQRSCQAELGLKWRRDDLAVDLVAFFARVSDEIGTLTNVGGRSSFQNVGGISRRGLELGLGWRPSALWRGQIALNTLNARYINSFLTCAGIPCTTLSTLVPVGNRVAGTQSGSAWAELVWQRADLGELAFEGRSVGRTAANDANGRFFETGAPRNGLLALRVTG